MMTERKALRIPFFLIPIFALLLLFGLKVSAAPVQNLTLSGNAYYDSTQECYILTQEKQWQNGLITFSDVKCNSDFTISLEFYTGDADHVDSRGGADGIVVMFYANPDVSASNGGDLNFTGRGGYGVEVDTYYGEGSGNSGDPKYNHIALIQGRTSNHLAIADATDYTEDGKWHTLVIRCRSGNLTVKVDGTEVLTYTGIKETGNYGICISGSTGDGYNWHKVRNIYLSDADWLDNSKWSGKELEEAEQLDLIPDMLYDTDFTKPITRLEFAAVSVKTYEALNGTSALPSVVNPFTDCSNTEMLKAYNLGITKGISTTRFDPDSLLTREQAATMLTRVFKRVTMPGWTPDKDADYPLSYTMPARFDDDAAISGWAKDSVYFMAANDIIKGIGGNVFAPRNTTTQQEALQYANATREQALAIAVRMVKKFQ